MHYWLRIFLIAYWVVNLSMVGMVQADAPQEGVTDNVLVDDSFEGALHNYVSGTPGMRQVNGTLWHFGTNITTFGVDHAITASYSSDNGTSWTSFVLMDNTYPGFELNGFPWMVNDAVGLSNNSIIIVMTLKNFDTASRYECWLFCHWNNSDLSQWELFDVYSNSGQNIDRDPSIAVNDTDTVMITYEIDGQNYVYYDFFSPANRVAAGNLKSAIEPQGSLGPWALCDSNGVFFVGMVIDADDDLDIYTSDGSWTLVWTESFDSSYFAYDCIITGDDTIVALSAKNDGGVMQLHYWNETAEGLRYIVDLGTGDTTCTYPKLGIYNNSETTVSIISYSLTDDSFKRAYGDYYIDSEVWQTRWSDGEWDETHDTAKDYTGYQPHDLFPIVTDPVSSVINRTMLPNTGFYAHITDYYVTGDTEDLREIHANTTTWPASPYYHYDPFYEAPEEPEEPGADADWNWTWWGDVACISSFMVIAVVLLVAIIIIQGTTSRR